MSRNTMDPKWAVVTVVGFLSVFVGAFFFMWRETKANRLAFKTWTEKNGGTYVYGPNDTQIKEALFGFIKKEIPILSEVSQFTNGDLKVFVLGYDIRTSEQGNHAGFKSEFGIMILKPEKYKGNNPRSFGIVHRGTEFINGFWAGVQHLGSPEFQNKFSIVEAEGNDPSLLTDAIQRELLKSIPENNISRILRINENGFLLSLNRQNEGIEHPERIDRRLEFLLRVARAK